MEVILQYRHFLRTAPANSTATEDIDRELKETIPRPSVTGGDHDHDHRNRHEAITTGPDAETNVDVNADVDPTSISTATSITAHEPTSQPTSQQSQQASEKSSSYTYVSFQKNEDGSSDRTDKSNPQNWSMLYKAWVIAQISFLALSLTFASSVSSAASSGARMELSGGSELAGTATTGAFVVGIGFGAMPFAPLSECESTDS